MAIPMPRRGTHRALPINDGCSIEETLRCTVYHHRARRQVGPLALQCEAAPRGIERRRADWYRYSVESWSIRLIADQRKRPA